VILRILRKSGRTVDGVLNELILALGNWIVAVRISFVHGRMSCSPLRILHPSIRVLTDSV
jgi:hypothetical protein